jgi:hypothetical protein
LALRGPTNDYQLSGSACFGGIGQTPVTAGGRDLLVYRFVAPSAGAYSFRQVEPDTATNPVLRRRGASGRPPAVGVNCTWHERSLLEVGL